MNKKTTKRLAHLNIYKYYINAVKVEKCTIKMYIFPETTLNLCDISSYFMSILLGFKLPSHGR